MRRKAFYLGLSVICLLCSCSGSGNPSKGYKMYKDEQTKYMQSIGGTGKEISYKSCKYVYITGDGNMDAGSLLGNVYYSIKYTMTLKSGSKDVSDFVFYDSENDGVYPTTSTAYDYAFSLVSNGSFKGEKGTL